MVVDSRYIPAMLKFDILPAKRGSSSRQTSLNFTPTKCVSGKSGEIHSTALEGPQAGARRCSGSLSTSVASIHRQPPAIFIAHPLKAS